MLETYRAVLRDQRIEWNDAPPADLPREVGVRVLVTLLEKMEPPDSAGQGERMAAALEQLAASQSLMHIIDVMAWERTMRRDRPLPGREP